ncbi:glycosyltransferase [Microvirga arabica]|uniref:Glycosyltransferase n=1 Tax=Microvirga arabica TaxID=1128671 RepID=A0ABV6Y613_9HYPH
MYLAPIEASDARRMKAIAETVDAPFVVHFWDFLDDGIRSDPATRWLIEQAAAVFVINQAMLDSIAPLRSDAQTLLFTRRPSLFRAAAPSGDTLRILLIGDIVSYRDGVHRLLEAVTILRERGCKIAVRYIGRPRVLSVLGLSDGNQIEAVGFLPSDEARDRAIAECDIGFLPGPMNDPADDPRSRYSIPSRVLDFMATGLPFVGTLHRNSAAFRFCSDLGLGEHIACRTVVEVADAIQHLANDHHWSSRSTAGLQAFSTMVRSDRYDGLKEVLLQGA